MMNEDQLRIALQAAAGTIDPPDGSSEILSAAAESLRTRSIAASAGARHTGGAASTRARFAYAAALVLAVVVALTSLGIALRPTGNSPRVTSAIAAPPLGSTGPYWKSLRPMAANERVNGDSLSVVTGAAKSSTRSLPSNQRSLVSKVVATGTVGLSVPNGAVGAAVDRLSSMAASEGGFVASSQVTAGSAGAPARGTITLRVPEPHFAALVVAVQKVGHTTSVITNSTDVTSQYVDYESQISALEASRAQYLAIMARATTIGEILSVQAQLNTIEVELQQLEGQRNVLDNQAAYGTLTVQLNHDEVASHGRSGIGRAWTQSVSGFASGVDGLVRALGPAFFALLCLLAAWLVGRPAWRASRRRFL